MIAVPAMVSAQSHDSTADDFPAGAAENPAAGSRFSWLLLCGAWAAATLVCVGLLAAVFLPPMNAAHESARRGSCIGRLRQIALAIAVYENVHKSYPPAYVADANGKPLYSWRVLILPYLDEKDLYDRWDKNAAWDSPQNKPLLGKVAKLFTCPSSSTPPGETNYLAVVDPRTVFTGPSGRKAREIRDGAYATILIVESHKSVPWAAPVDLTMAEIGPVNSRPDTGLGSSHSGGVCIVAFADTHTLTLDESTPLEKIRAMLTADAGDTP